MVEKTKDEGPISFTPTKEFFIKTLTKDVELDSAILDLIDNSIDGYIVNNLIDKRNIKIHFNKTSFHIEDNCGGIKKDRIYDEVFKLGAIKKEKKETIGIYGIGLKRSMFKIGKDIRIESDDGTDYFSIHIDENWIDDDYKWKLNFEKEEASKGEPFFRLKIEKLYPEVAESLSLITFQEKVIEKIRKFHSMHIEKRVNIFINDIKIEPYTFNFLQGKGFSPLSEKIKIDDIDVNIIAGFTGEKDIFGWCIFCNDRMILKNDTSSRTGFRYTYYHPTQDNEILGMVFFNCNDPSKLPMKSTKDDVILENRAYRNIQVRMEEITKELKQGFTQKLYQAKDSQGETVGKSVYKEVPLKNWKEIPSGQKIGYPLLKTTPILEEPSEYTTITYQVLIKEIMAVKKHMGNPTMTNKKVGEKTFKYFCKLEKI